jgi:hypothetical protein
MSAPAPEVWPRPPSPDLSPLYDAEFAVLLAKLIGYREPLIARLRDRHMRHDRTELEYLADVLEKHSHRWPTQKQVENRREKLRRAAYYLQFLHAGEGKGKEEAKRLAAEKCRVDAKTIARAVKYAKGLGGGEWWRSAEHLAKKGRRKLASLRATY